MKARTFKYWATFMVAFGLFLVSCHDENVFIDESDHIVGEGSDSDSENNGGYNNGADYENAIMGEINAKKAYYDLDWDGTEHLEYKLGSTTGGLTVPWAIGSTLGMGVPSEWIDFPNPSTEERAYSHHNGWELVYSNLADPEQDKKLFALYNKYTGILRIFFCEIDYRYYDVPGFIYGGIQVNGSNLLNFAFENPLPMDVSPSSGNTTYVFMPASNFFGGLTGVWYMSHNWYGMEVECAYDANAAPTSSMDYNIWFATTTIMGAEDSAMKYVAGNVSATYTGSNSWNFVIKPQEQTAMVTKDAQYAGWLIGKEIAEKAGGRDKVEKQKYTQLWEALAAEMPSLQTSEIVSGVESLFTKGAPALADLGGRLLNSAVGMGNTETISPLSMVKVRSAAAIGILPVGTGERAGKEMLAGLALPGGAEPSALYNERLGVWNLATAPQVHVDQFSICKYNSSANTPNTKPTSWETRYDLRLQPVELVLNPAIKDIFEELPNDSITQDLVFTDALEDVTPTPSPYGLNNGNLIYASDNPRLVTLKETMPDIKISSFNPDTSFASLWDDKIKNVKETMYCRVAFKLKHKTTGQVIGFSKYFKVNAVKGTHTHNDLY